MTDPRIILLDRKKEELRRRQMRGSLLEWATYLCNENDLPSIPPDSKPALHHRFILDRLQSVVEGRIRKLMILVPPGAGKSVYTSIAFPTYFLNVFPNRTILACSHTHTLVEGFGRYCRNIVERHSNVLGYGLSSDSTAAGDWQTNKKGRYFCAGVGGNIAGHRAGLGLIDDYCGSQEQADSESERQKTVDWYKNDFVPRLWPTAPQIIIANRRHEADLVGWILENRPEGWVVIRLPMLAEDEDPLGRSPGDRLWPEWYTDEQVQEARKDPRTWAGLYQQRPAPEEGNFFKKDWLVEYRPADLPRDLNFYCASDHACKTKQVNDRTCLLPAGVDPNGRIWILPDWFWDRADTGVVVEQMLKMAQRRKPLRWWAGSDHITGSIGPFLSRRMQETGIYFPLDEVTARGDKSARAQSIAGRMSQKMVMFPSYAPGWDKAKHELLTFPGGAHDDFVDALSELGRGLDQIVKPNLTVRTGNTALPDLNRPITMRWIKA